MRPATPRLVVSTAVIPYYAYARSDKKDAPRISIAGRLVADLLNTAGASRVLTNDAARASGAWFLPYPGGSPQRDEYFRSPTFATASLAIRWLSRRIWAMLSQPHTWPVSSYVPVAAGSKRRIDDEHVLIEGIVGDVGRQKRHRARRRDRQWRDHIGACCVCCASTDVGSIEVACTHGLFTGSSIPRLAAQLDVQGVVTTNTVPLAPEKKRGTPRSCACSR